MIAWLAETTVVAAALAGAVALLCRGLRPRPAVRHALWLVVLLKLLAPPLVAWALASPVLWGLGRPRLLWPAARLGRLSPQSERAAIVHELAHLRRRDHWVGWLQLPASCVWWWSPLFWAVRRQIGRAAELAC